MNMKLNTTLVNLILKKVIKEDNDEFRKKERVKNELKNC